MPTHLYSCDNEFFLSRAVTRMGSVKIVKNCDGRATTIPIHGNAEIGGWLFQEILEQLGITEDQFNELK